MVVIKLLGLNSGHPTPYDGCYLSSYDVGIDGVDSSGARLSARVEAYPDLQRAMKFTDIVEARDCWMKVDPRVPVREDGKPNRPLTAFSVSFEPYVDPSAN